MYKVTREINFCYGHRLLNYPGKCSNLHGHNGLAAVTFETQELDKLGIAVDFVEIKNTVSRWIDEVLDHKVLLHKDDPIVTALKAINEPLYVMEENPSAENIAALIFNYIASQGYPVVEVTLWESTSTCATYAPAKKNMHSVKANESIEV